MDGARDAGTSTPRKCAGANAQIGDVLAAFVAFFEPLDRRAHFARAS